MGVLGFSLSFSTSVFRKPFIPSSYLQAATAITLEPNSGSFPEETSSADSPKVGVLMLNLGGPEKSEDVEGMNRFFLLVQPFGEVSTHLCCDIARIFYLFPS